MKAVVFDIGGTLMEYRNMPYVWFDYYADAFAAINKKLSLGLTEYELAHSLDILKTYNPGIIYREIDYLPEKIFGDVTADWHCKFNLTEVITEFFRAMNLEPYIYPETMEVLRNLKSRGVGIGTYTNVVSGMPDEMHRSYFTDLIQYFDVYVSSVNCGFRKPNPRGLEICSEALGVGKGDMLFVGDEKKDPETARRFGCKSVLINRSQEHRNFGQTYTISDLRELYALI